MADIKVARIESESDKKSTKRELYAMVCYYYPQYTLADVQKLPARDFYLLLRTAKKLEAINNYNMVQIVAAPHSKKGAAIDKLLKHFKQIIRG